MQSYIGAGYPVMFFNMAASRGSAWYDAVRHGGVDARPPPPLPPPALAPVRRPTRHFIVDILNLDEDSDDEEMALKRRRRRSSAWTSLSPSPPSLSSNTDDATTSPDSSEQASAAEDLRLTSTSMTASCAGHHSAGLDSRTSDSPPSDADVSYISDHGMPARSLTPLNIQQP